jgi:NADH:ubiquinone oxidoreductase subunit F (NADH-binding)
METSAAPVITISSSPGFTSRLLSVEDAREDLAAYRQLGGYQPLAGADELVGEVESSGLLGRGGAGFPLAVKVRAVRDNGRAAGGAVVVANGEEGEPASIKDRWLLRHRPHLILDGLRLAAAMVAADRTYVYVSDPESARSVEAALAELGPSAFDGVAVEVRSVEPGYIAGEETAAVRALNGGPVKPTDKPPRPFQEGVGGLPTLVSNVETLAILPYLQHHGAAEFRALGTSESPGSFLVTVTGAGRAPGLYEIPHGLPFPELLALHGVSSDQVQGVLMGGYFAGLLDRGVLDATLDHETLRGLGSGTGARAAVAGALRDGVATEEDLARLRRWSVVLRGRGACATLDAATNIAASLLAKFPDIVDSHLHNGCQTCQLGAFTADRPYQVEAVSQV